MEFTQTQTFSFTSSAASGSLESLALVPTCIDERLIADEVLGVH